MNPWVERPPLHSTVKEFNDILISSLTFRRWKSGKSYCVLLFLNLKISISGKENLCRRCSLPPGYVRSQLPVFAETPALLRRSQSQLPRQPCPQISGVHFPLSRDRLKHILLSLQSSLYSLKPLWALCILLTCTAFQVKHPQLTTAHSWAEDVP